MSTLLLRLLGDMATPAVEDLLKANESLDWSLPTQRLIVKKKSRLIRPGLQPTKILRVGGETVVPEQKKWKQKYVKPRLYVQSPTYFSVGQLTIPFDPATGVGETVVIDGEIFEVWITKEGRRILIGAGIYRNANVENVGKVPALFKDPVIKEFEDKIPEIAHNYEGVEIDKAEHAAGVWEQNREPSFVISGTAHDSYAVEALASKLAQEAPEPQMAAAVWSENPQAEGAMYEISGVKDHERAVQTLMKHGFTGQSVLFEKGSILLLDKDGAMRDNITKAASELGHKFTTSRGDVDFIGEEEYGEREKAYQQSHRPQAVGEASQVQDFPVSGSQAEELIEFIRKVGSRWVIFSQEGKRLGTFTSKAVAAKRLGEIEWFKKNKDEQRKKQRKPPIGHQCTPPVYPNSVGTRYWMGVGGGYRQQYGDYQQARPKLSVVLEGTSEHWVTIDGKHIPISAGSTPSGQGKFPFYREMQAQAYAAKKQKEEEKAARERDARTPEGREKHLRETPVTGTDEDPNEGSHSAAIFPVDLADGTRAMFKPESGEPYDVRQSVSHGYQTEREVGAWEVAKVVGMDDLVAPAVVSEVNGERGALMEFQHGIEADSSNNPYDGPRDLARAAIFDYVIGNEDRHQGNWMVELDRGSLDEKMHLIDHSLAFPDAGPYYQSNQEFIETAAGNPDVEHSDDFSFHELTKPYIDNKAKVIDAVKAAGLPRGSVRGVKERLDALADYESWNDLMKYAPGAGEWRDWSNVRHTPTSRELARDERRKKSSAENTPRSPILNTAGEPLKSTEVRAKLGQHRYSNPNKESETSFLRRHGAVFKKSPSGVTTAGEKHRIDRMQNVHTIKSEDEG